MKLLLIALLVFFKLLDSCAQGLQRYSCKPFNLSISVRGEVPDSLKIIYIDCMGLKYNSDLVLSNGKVRIHGNIANAGEVILFTDYARSKEMDGPKTVRIIAQPGEMKLVFNINNGAVQNIRVSGSEAQLMKDTWENENSSILEAEGKYYDLAFSSKETDKINKQAYKAIYDSLYKLKLNRSEEYIKQNPSSYLSAYFLRRYIRRMSLDSIQKYYTQLDRNVQESQFGRDVISEILARTKDTAFILRNSDARFARKYAGIKGFYDFSLKDSNGSVQNLAKFEGKYVVIDFWGSWCRPCIANIPHLQKLQAEMVGKPVEFVSISIDTDVVKWKDALVKYKYPGLNLIDDEQLAAIYYKVPWVPKYVIINPDGSIANEEAPHPISDELAPLLHAILEKKTKSSP